MTGLMYILKKVDLSGETLENYYPSKILGFVTINEISAAVIQCSERPIIWSELERNLFVKTTIGTDLNISYVSVPITALVHPLCVVPDYGGHKTQFIIVLPRKNWTRYFGDCIKSEYEKTL